MLCWSKGMFSSPSTFRKPLMSPFSTWQIMAHPCWHFSRCPKSLKSIMHVSQNQPSKRLPSPDLKQREVSGSLCPSTRKHRHLCMRDQDQFDGPLSQRHFASQKVCPLSHLLSDSSSFLLFYSINWSAKLPLPMHQCCPRYPWAAHVVQHTSHLCMRLRLIWSPTTLKMFCHWSQGMSSLPSSVR